MNYTFRYRSSRAEVWRWYWRLWRSRLWHLHAVIAGSVSFAATSHDVWHGHLLNWGGRALLVFVLLVGISVGISQLLFKGDERILEVGPDGWSTQIGKKRSSRGWAELAPVKDESGVVVIASKQGNALLIPDRAFESAGQRSEFLQDVRRWQVDSG